MAKNPLSRIHSLSARIEEHLHQFEPMDDETDYSPVQQEKKKKNPLLRAGMAGAAVAGGAAIASNKDKIKSGYQAAKTGVTNAAASAKEAGRTAAFRGMRGTANVMNKTGNLANRTANKIPMAFPEKKAGLKVGETLKKGAKVLKKKSMKFFSSADIAGIQRIEAKFRQVGV